MSNNWRIDIDELRWLAFAVLDAANKGKLSDPADDYAMALSEFNDHASPEVLIILLDQLEAARTTIAKLREPRGLWPDELQQTVRALEEKYDVEMVSMSHHAKFVDESERLEGELAAARSELAEMTSAYNVRNDEVTGLSGMLKELRVSLEQAQAEAEREKATREGK